MKSIIFLAYTILISACGLISTTVPASDHEELLSKKILALYKEKNLLLTPSEVSQILNLKLAEKRCVTKYSPITNCGYEFEVIEVSTPIIRKDFYYKISEERDIARLEFKIDANEVCLKKGKIEEVINQRLIRNVVLESPPSQDLSRMNNESNSKAVKYFIFNRDDRLGFDFSDKEDCANTVFIFKKISNKE